MDKSNNQIKQIKNIALKSLIACFVAASAVAVGAVVIGDLSSAFAKSLLTIFAMAFHAGLIIAYMDAEEKNIQLSRVSFASKVFLAIIVASFPTVLLGIWGVFDGNTTAKTYFAYSVITFAVFHAKYLQSASGLKKSLDMIIYVNYLLIVVVASQIITLIYTGLEGVPSYILRFLAATSIIDTTLTILTVLFYYINRKELALKNYGQAFTPGNGGQNQLTNAQQKSSGEVKIAFYIVMLYIFIQVLLPVLILFAFK